MKKIILGLAGILMAGVAFAQNPLITNQFTADPTARVFNGKVYVYPSHDIPTPADKPNLRKDWFCMADYHVFSSSNLTEWTDHGMIVDQKQVPWVDGESYSMWAPDCVEKNGKYYFYFPANIKRTEGRRGGFGVGVGIADKPEGPFVFQNEPIKGVNGIDPCVFIDKDGTPYIYWPSGGIRVSKLKENMIELDGESKSLEITDLPAGFKEGPFIFQRKGIYYLTFPHVNKASADPNTEYYEAEELSYCMGTSPTGPFKYMGTIMDKSATRCWTNHHSLVEYQGEWYLFYHHNDLSPNFDKNRSIRADKVVFNEDGTIQKVKPTLRGVGISNSTLPIQLDRYSEIAKFGVSIDFIDTTNRFLGWKTKFNAQGAWLRYNAVGIESNLTGLECRYQSTTGATLELRAGSLNGELISSIILPKSSAWKSSNVKISGLKAGNKDLFVLMKNNGAVEVDWIRFLK